MTDDGLLRTLPDDGLEPGALERLLDVGGGGDVDWRHGRGWSLVYDSPAWHQDLVDAAVARFGHENALSHAAFPSAARFESSVIAMVASIVSPETRAYGVFASGSTEATMIAVKAYRDRAGVATPAIVIPATAHPAFRKAAAYLGLAVVTVEVGADGVPDVDEVLAALDANTVAVGLSAPCYPYGVVDPIVAIAAGAAARGVGVHVDAAMGGLFLPFLGAAGAQSPRFGLDVPGVTSVAVDLHKYGYAAKGASVLLFADPELRHAAYHTFIGWPGGAYAASGVLGTRSVAAAAGAFTAMAALGRRGYEILTASVMETTRRLQQGLADAAGLEPVGHPPMSVFAATADDVPIGALAGALQAKGWWIDAQTSPPSIHFTVFPRHAHVVDALVDDMRAAAEHVTDAGTPAESALPSSYGVMMRGGAALTEEALFADLDARFDGPGGT